MSRCSGLFADPAVPRSTVCWNERCEYPCPVDRALTAFMQTVSVVVDPPDRTDTEAETPVGPVSSLVSKCLRLCQRIDRHWTQLVETRTATAELGAVTPRAGTDRCVEILLPSDPHSDARRRNDNG
jgi:hypothetical protein